MTFIIFGLAIFATVYLWAKMSPVAKTATTLFLALIMGVSMFEVHSIIAYSLEEGGAPPWLAWAMGIMIAMAVVSIIGNSAIQLQERSKKGRDE